MVETMMERRQRLAIFLPALYGGGAERTMLNLAEGIARRGYAVDLVLARAVGPYLGEIPESVRLVDLEASRSLFGLPALVHYLRSQQPEAMLSALTYANLIALWAQRLARTPTRIVINEQNTFSHSNLQLSYWYGWLMVQLVKGFYPWAQGIVGVSRGVADDLAEATGIGRERIQVIHNPIVTPELRKKAQAPVTHPWFYPDQPPVVLAVGRLSPQKDYPTLIQAFGEVRRNRPLRLLILGEGEERPALEALIRQLGLQDDVSLPGFAANPYPYMARVSLFVLSSRWEGLPTVLVEALYCGAPVIATDCPSGPREILANGQYGQLMPVGDVVALAKAIEAALDGQTPRPPQESWLPFETETVVNLYIDMLFEG
jgi:glycosyltransferase involved in cell wall biosynthesis